MLAAVRFNFANLTEKRLELVKGEIWAMFGKYLTCSILAQLGALLGFFTIPRHLREPTRCRRRCGYDC